MHCERCNVDFPEGLRYCKWCGEALVDRPRITSELHSCPSCSAAVQPGWTYCKACGERLRTVAREGVSPVCPACGVETQAGSPKCLRCGHDLLVDRAKAAESSDTTIFAMCSNCGEKLDTGSLYCKGCGSAVYTEKPAGSGSALLCGACKSYSPLGSPQCRVCGAPFTQGSRAIVDVPAGVTTVQQKPPTLPDLEEYKSPDQHPADSGANTVVFSGKDPKAGPPTGSVDTSMLPGTAGSRSEQQAPTAIMQMGRITGPVEPGEVPGRSGDLDSAALKPVDSPPAGGDQQPAAIQETLEFAAVAPPSKSEDEPTTLGLASESESEGQPVGSESKTAVFVSPAHRPAPSKEQPSGDDVGTRIIAPERPAAASEPTRVMQSPSGKTADRVAATGKISEPPKQSPAISPEPTPAALSQSEIDSSQVTSQPPQKKTGVMIATVVVVLLLVAGAGYVGWLLFGRGKPAPPPPPVVVEQPPAPPPPVPEKPPAPLIPEGMIAVTAGTYTIGRDGADPLEQPEHKADVRPFYIDRTEVTNAAYKKFVDATSHKPPSNWTGNTFPEGKGESPVTGVSWQDAADYAAWAGKRLPTEVEWEAAARGAEARIYPWGNDWRSGAANIGQKPDKISADQYPAGVKPVGQYPDGASPVGALDMVGNAWEWVADEIKVYRGNTESQLNLTPGTTFRVIRGGAYDGNKINDAAYRGYLDGSQPYPKVGFRCAKDAK